MSRRDSERRRRRGGSLLRQRGAPVNFPAHVRVSPRSFDAAGSRAVRSAQGRYAMVRQQRREAQRTEAVSLGLRSFSPFLYCFSSA